MDWAQVNLLLKHPNRFQRLLLIFKPWISVKGPKGLPCQLTDMDDNPLYEYKILGSYTYHLRMQRSPGFPGS